MKVRKVRVKLDRRLYFHSFDSILMIDDLTYHYFQENKLVEICKVKKINISKISKVV